jgi:tRNA dimethylallyltransferase
MNCLVGIVGPTAVGKSKLAIHLASIFSSELGNADSRQVYRYLDIATAKPGPEERALIPHYLIDVVTPDQDFNLALYQEMALHVIGDIQQRHKLPLMVGGSGLYVWSVIEGWKVPPVPPDPRWRLGLEERATREGNLVLYRELENIDPAAAAKIDPSNLRRVIRALEVCRATGAPLSRLWAKEPPGFETLLIGLTTERDDLYRRIDLRVDEMIERGLVDEVRGLIDRGYSLDLPAMSGIGYHQIGLFLQGEMDLATAIQQIKFETHRIARHQYAWFRPGDNRIHWFDIRKGVEQPVERLIEAWLEERKASL